MRAVVQRVSSARVVVDGEVVGACGRGFVVLVGVGVDDGQEDVSYMVDKIAHLRIFTDRQGKMNLSLQDVGGQILAVPNFTLYGDARHGRRPDFTKAAPGSTGRALFDAVVTGLRAQGIQVATGVFGAHMSLELVNDGPVTVLLDSRHNF